MLVATALLVATGVMPAGATWQTFSEPKIISMGYDGTQGEDDSREPAISSDGRYIAYRSDADNIVPGLSGGYDRIFRYDTVARENVLVDESLVPAEPVNTNSSRPRISSDGRYVMFTSSFGFVPEDTNGGEDIYVRDMDTGDYMWVDFYGDGSALDWNWNEIEFAGDGSYIVFDSWNGDLLGDGKTTVGANVWGYDLASEEATLVSVPATATAGAPATRGSRSPAISGDGRYIVFFTGNSWDAADANGDQDFYVRDTTTGELMWVDFHGDGSSVGPDGGNIGWNITMSADASIFAFEAWDSLLPGDTMANRDVYAYNMASQEATLVSGPHVNSRGSRDPSISDDGRYIMFYTGQAFAADDMNDDQDVYIKDLMTGEFMRVPVMGDAGLPGDDIDYPSMSGDGKHLVFEDESDLIASDTNGQDDIYYMPIGGYRLVEGAERMAGANRYTTAIEVSKQAFPFGADTVVIATGENWPDALGGSALAGAVDGPILLTRPGALPDEVKAELMRLGARNAYVLGGTAAVSSAVETQLNQMLPGFVWRLSGADRYTTTSAIAKRAIAVLGPLYDGRLIVTTGANFPDSVGAAPMGAGFGWPIVLVDPTKSTVMLPTGSSGAVILGGTVAVKPAIETYLEGEFGDPAVDRVGGATRYETSAMVAQYGVDNGLTWDGLGIATGMDFPDSLTGGVALGLHRSPLLLTPSTVLHPAAEEKLEDNKADIDSVGFFGGTSAVSAAVEAKVKMILGL
jgi:putative cell wall-binding protein/Tol biopolymer transport system component